MIPCGRSSEPGETNKELLVRTHLKLFKEQVEAAQEFSPTLVNSHSCKDYFTEDMATEFFQKALAWQNEKGYKVTKKKDERVNSTTTSLFRQVLHETHRKRFLHSPWLSRSFVPKLLSEVPLSVSLGMVADLSHWVNVAETNTEDPDLTQVIEDLGPQFGHVHCRVGYDHGPQVPDPRAPSWIGYMEGHERWWDHIWKCAFENGAEEVMIIVHLNPN